jgi:hypothetical protein
MNSGLIRNIGTVLLPPLCLAVMLTVAYIFKSEYAKTHEWLRLFYPGMFGLCYWGEFLLLIKKQDDVPFIVLKSIVSLGVVGIVALLFLMIGTTFLGG